MNPTNGLLLCRMHDAAFEKGAITVAEDLGSMPFRKNLR